MICDVLGEENNGTTIAAMNLRRSLIAKGHTVRVVCPDENRIGEKDFYVVPSFNLGLLNGYVRKNGVSLAKPVKKTLTKAIDGVDVVHVMIPFMLGNAGARIAIKKGIPVTAGFHCQAENFTNHIFMMNLGIANTIAYKVYYRNLYKKCDCVHYPTQFICDVFEEATKPTNHYVISNGVNSSFYPAPTEKPNEWKDKFVILFTGRYSKEKSHKVLIDAVAKSKHKDKIQLVFAGDGPQKQKIIERAKKKLTLQPVFRFYSREELVNVIRCADLYVHPAEIEIEAIACLEAIACGKVPVIADSPRSATRFFALSPDNLFRYNDSDDLANKIDMWIDDPEKLKECSKQYEGYAAQFDFDTCMNKMEQMLFDAVEGKNHG